MNKKHLWWIIPVSLLVGLGIGIKVGFDIAYDSFEAFGKWACDISTAGMEMCVDIVKYMSDYNGTTTNAIKQYAIENNQTIQNFVTLIVRRE